MKVNLQPSPTLRIAAGLVGLCIALLILVDWAFKVLPDRRAEASATQARLAETTAILVADAIRAQDFGRASASLAAVQSRHPHLVSAAVRRSDGLLVAAAGAHAADWADDVHSSHTQTRVTVPIRSAQGEWGRVELSFQPAVPTTLRGWLSEPVTWLGIGLPAVATLLVFAYLRRVLVHLNPMAVVPERLRDAFDGMTAGVALLDMRGRLVLANMALRDMAGMDPERMHGRTLREAAHLRLADESSPAPWDLALTGTTARNVRVLVGHGAATRVGMMNCSALTDPAGRVRGCLATVEDITEVERSNDELRIALQELEASRQRIEAQNRELTQLATCDPLTTLLNRRAFFDKAVAVIGRAASQQGTVAVAMLDVDHFKRFNDQYGHATGDLVLQRVAERMQRSVRPLDLVARYGGEEFCILMADLDLSAAQAMADRVRRAIEADAGHQLSDGADVAVTASLGLCWRQFPGAPADLAEMLRRADAALYEAKRGGRNAVRVAAIDVSTHSKADGLDAVAPQPLAQDSTA